jgi:PEP-CTERM motif
LGFLNFYSTQTLQLSKIITHMAFKKSTLLGALALIFTLPAVHAVNITIAGDSIKGGELIAGTFTAAIVGTAGGANNFPAGEPPASAIDGVAVGAGATKYLNFAKEDTGYIVLPSGGTIVNGISFVTANDDPRRDPASYILYGSNAVSSLAASIYTLAGDGFTQISTGALTLPNTGTNLSGNLAGSEGRGLAASVAFANTTPYTSYILVFPTIRDTTANSMQIAEAVLTFSVPEPATTGFLALGLLGALTTRRRHQA